MTTDFGANNPDFERHVTLLKYAQNHSAPHKTNHKETGEEERGEHLG